MKESKIEVKSKVISGSYSIKSRLNMIGELGEISNIKWENEMSLKPGFLIQELKILRWNSNKIKLGKTGY